MSEPLDETTERVIEDLAYRAYWEGKNQSTGTFKNERIAEKRNVLRKRIRELVEEAGSAGHRTSPPPVCPTCHEPRDADVPCSNAFHIAPPTDTPRPREPLQELDRLMDRFSTLSRALWAGNIINEAEARRELPDVHIAIRDLFKRLVEERDSAVAEGEVAAVSLFSDFQWASEELTSVRSEVERLRETALTDIEADTILAATDGMPEELNDKLITIVERASALRRLASSTQKEE